MAQTFDFGASMLRGVQMAYTMSSLQTLALQREKARQELEEAKRISIAR